MISGMKAGISAAMLCAVGAGVNPAMADESLIEPLVVSRGDLSEYLWTNRVVLIFAPSAQDPDYRVASEMIVERRSGLRERDIVVLAETAPEQGGVLRVKFGVDGFRMLLIGKDGGIKMDEPAPIPAETLFATIDAMPMRQREMGEN
ncbi:DUF4174 domain-containing protein [Thioclava pacifica]|nr:DUF4174 domain-containing protein [Thioclava pacifica]